MITLLRGHLRLDNGKWLNVKTGEVGLPSDSSEMEFERKTTAMRGTRRFDVLENGDWFLLFQSYAVKVGPTEYADMEGKITSNVAPNAEVQVIDQIFFFKGKELCNTVPLTPMELEYMRSMWPQCPRILTAEWGPRLQEVLVSLKCIRGPLHIRTRLDEAIVEAILAKIPEEK